MPPPPDKDAKIPCPTPQHLQIELDALMSVLELREQEDTWEKMERGIIRFTGITRGGAYKHLPLFIDGMGKMGVGLKLGQCMLSDRGRLSGVATELLQTLAPRLGAAFNPLVSVYLGPLVQLLGRPNKVFLKRAEKCLWTIISNCHLSSILVELKRGLSDEAATCRRGCAAGFERALIDWDRANFGEKGVGILEEALRKVGADKDPEVRSTGKKIWTKFSEVWPERVDEFSGPLTPTIRRYLGVSAAASSQAGRSKPTLAPARRAPPRPAPPSLSASTSSVSIPAPPPPSTVAPAPIPPPAAVQMPPPPPPAPTTAPFSRAQLIGGRAVRPPPATTQNDALPSLPTSELAESSRPRRSPGKSSFPGGPAVPASHSDAFDQPRQRILSARAPRYPPGVLGLGQHGRSMSHSVLPKPLPEAIPPLLNPAEPAYTHPAEPARPAFPTSFSTTSLPITTSEENASWHPARRFADGGARITRPALSSSISEYDTLASGPSRANHVPFTPSVLRGAVRSHQPAPSQPTRPTLGQAQRRIINAPHAVQLMEVCTPQVKAMEVCTPQVKAVERSASVRDRIVEMERKAAEAEAAELEAARVPLPISPVAERFAATIQSTGSLGGGGSRSGTPTLSRVRKVPGADQSESPMMPMLARSLRGHEQNGGVEVGGTPEQEVKAEALLMDEEEPEESVGDVTFSDRRGQGTEAQPSGGQTQDRPVEMEAISTAGAPVAEDIVPAHPTSVPIAVLDTPHQSQPILTGTRLESEAKSGIAQVDPAPPPPAIVVPIVPTPSSSAPAPAPAAAKTRRPPLPSTSNASRRAPAATTASVVAERLPPVATSRTAKPRLPANEHRKPFRPTTKPTPTAAVPDSTKSGGAEAAAPREPVVKTANKPPLPPIRAAPTASRAASSSSTAAATAKATAAAPPKPALPAAQPRAVSGSSNLTKPTASSSHRAATAAPVPKPRVPSSSATSAFTLLPTVKKDKVKRKAAVPSFRPTRTADTIVGKGTVSLSASTASVRSNNPAAKMETAEAKVIVAKVRIRPEAVPLPISPGEHRAAEIPLPVSPTSRSVSVEAFTGRVRVKVRPESLELAPTGGGGERVDTAPPAENIPLPPSPTTITLFPTPTVPSMPASTHALTAVLSPSSETKMSSGKQPTAGLDNIGLSTYMADRTPISKASTAPAGSDWSGSELGDEDGSADGVTFGRVDVKGNTFVHLVMGDGEKDLIELSAASRPSPHTRPIIHVDETTGEEKDLIEFSAPSRSAVVDGVENTSSGGDASGMEKAKLVKLDPAVAGGAGVCVGSPRVVLSERDRNGVSKAEEVF